jgi:hypothetical protein
MSTLEEDMGLERRRIDDLCRRARRRHQECSSEAESFHERGTRAAAQGDAKSATDLERRSQKARSRARRYAELIQELVSGGDRLAAEVLLARFSGPEMDQLVAEVERSRDLVIQRATALLRARDQHRALRHRWVELADKIRLLRHTRGLPEARTTAEFRILVTPATYAQQPDGPTYREVSDIVHHIDL